jgi:hypothetical protein
MNDNGLLNTRKFSKNGKIRILQNKFFSPFPKIPESTTLRVHSKPLLFYDGLELEFPTLTEIPISKFFYGITVNSYNL